MKKILALTSVLLLAASLSYAQSGTGTTNLSVVVGPEAAIVVGSTPALTSGSIFGDYTATTPLTYYVRTTTGGSITLQLTTDLSSGGPNGGPSVAAPPTAGDTLKYTCSATAPPTGSATACTGSQTVVALTTTYPVATFGTNTQSAKGGTSASVSWDLTNDPNYKAGSYTTGLVTFTISAS